MKPFILILLIMLVGSRVNAATVDVSAAVVVAAPSGFNFPPEIRVEDIDNKPGGSTLNQTFFSSQAAADVGTTLEPAASAASASANGVSGALRVDVRSDRSSNTTAFAEASTSVVETYTLTGSGTITASFEVDGSWNVLALGGQPFGVGGAVCIFCNAGIAQVERFQRSLAEGGTSGSIFGDVLTVSMFVDANLGPVDVQVGWNLGAFIGDPGRVDFGSTGKMFLETSGGLSATPSDANFLSDPIFGQSSDPSPVPLPAGAVLMLTGVAGLGFVRCRKRIPSAI